MQGQFGKKKEAEPEILERKKEPVHRPHASAMSEGPMLLSEGLKIEKQAREQNAKSVKTELEAILSRFKKKKRHAVVKTKGKKITDDQLPPDEPKDPGKDSGDGEGDDAKKDNFDGGDKDAD